MTTGNKIITKTISDVTYIPLECVQTGTDSIPFVYTKKGEKQIVLLGESNENNVIVEQGLKPGESLYLSTPAKPAGFRLAGQDLIAMNKQRAKEKLAEEERIRQEAAKASAGRQQMPMGGQMTPEMMARFGNMRGGNMPAGQFNGPRDTARMRRFMQMRNSQQGPQGMRRDTSAARRSGNFQRTRQQGEQQQGPGF